MKRVAAFLAFTLWAAPACAVEQRSHYGHLPIHVRGILHGWQAHEDVFHGRAGQRIQIRYRSTRPKWLEIVLTPLSARAPIYRSTSTKGWSGDVTLPKEGAYRLRVTIRHDEARRGGRVDFKIDVTELSRLAESQLGLL
ncbi:hypothetical protein [Methylocystis echinoides]|jgi:hypothetical protein|uniref:hypothetical protein n=1 Tax=Methylocystis echinoides TaxID=29468 RepID=UPI003418F154